MVELAPLGSCCHDRSHPHDGTSDERVHVGGLLSDRLLQKRGLLAQIVLHRDVSPSDGLMPHLLDLND